MIRYLTWIGKHSAKVPKFRSESMIPNSKGKLGYGDLVRMYDLRMYHISTFPDNEKGDDYVQELEFLHNELNHRAFNSTNVRAVLFLGILSFIAYYFYEPEAEKQNWNYKWNLVHDNSILATLDEGGSEGKEVGML